MKTLPIFLFICSTFVILPDLVAQQVRYPKPGAPGTWQVLGRTSANLTGDHDAIILRGPFNNFRQIKFRVSDAPLDIRRMTVTYDNGSTERIETRFTIPQGGDSRVIDLRGGSRKLRRVDFWYDTRGTFKGRADVTLYGRK